MKLARIVHKGPDGDIPRLVAVQPERQRVIDLASAERLRLERLGATMEAARRLALALFPASMSAAIALGDTFLLAAAQAIASAGTEAIVSLDEVQFLVPIDPPLLRDFSAFEQHVVNAAKQGGQAALERFYKAPLYYKGNPATVIGHEQEVIWPKYATLMDYELELGFVIGKGGRDLNPDEALSHLFGVTIFNDFSARNIQFGEMASGSLSSHRQSPFRGSAASCSI